MVQQLQAKLQQACAHHQSGQLAEAQQLYEQVLKVQPKNFDALHLLGVLALQQHDHLRAVDLITKALKINRNSVSAYNHRGAAYAALRQFDFALINYGKAIELEPQAEEAWNNRGNAHLAMGRFDDALADFDQALSLKSAYLEARNNRGNVLCEMGRHEEAIASFQRAADLNPSYGDLRWSLGMACLRHGEFMRGWAHSEGRLNDWAALGGRGDHVQARWTGGEALEGRTILLQCEQGLGDSIQFARYVPLLQQGGANVVFEVQAPVLPVLRHLLDVTWVPQGSPLPPFDTHSPLMSLPFALRTDLSNIPPPVPIQAEAAQVEKWRALLGERTRPRVGIVWSGNSDHVDDRKRSLALQDVLPLLSDEVEWISLHKEVRASDEATLAATPKIRHFGAQQQDFTDAAAMCELLDLVITVDTSMAHLAGSMGKPVWILLAFNADWRWLLTRTDSPWYPSATLYRQQRNGDWAGLLSQVGSDVRERFRTSAG